MSSKTTIFFKGISTQTIITFAMGVMEIVVFAIISRLLSKEDFGYYAAISGIIAIFLSISEAGLGASIIQKKDASNTFISTAFTWSLIIGSIISIIVFILAPTLANIIADSKLIIPLRAMSITIILHSIISVGNGILYRKLSFKTIGIISVLSYLIASLVSIIMAYLGLGLYAVIALPIVNATIYSCFLFYIIKFPKLQIQPNETKEIVSFGGWLTVGVILNNISNQLDKLVLSKWLSVEALGAYNRPAGFISSINTKIHSIFDTVLFPMLSNIQDDKNRITNVFFRAIALLNSFSIILAAIFFFNSELIITIFFGSSWLDIVPVMQVGAIGAIFSIDHRLVDCFFRSLNFVKLGTQIRFLGAGLMLISIYFGAQYGIIGVAWSILFANVILVIIKMIVLAIKVKAKITHMFIEWFCAWRSAIIPTIIGCTYLALPHTLESNIIFAIIFGTVIVIEFAFFPRLVGTEYQSSVYPYVEKIKNRIIGKK